MIQVNFPLVFKDLKDFKNLINSLKANDVYINQFLIEREQQSDKPLGRHILANVQERLNERTIPGLNVLYKICEEKDKNIKNFSVPFFLAFKTPEEAHSIAVGFEHNAKFIQDLLKSRGIEEHVLKKSIKFLDDIAKNIRHALDRHGL